MARNVIKSDFQSSKMAAGGHFGENNSKIKVVYWSEMVRDAIESDFRSSKIQNGRRGHLWEKSQKYKSTALIRNSEKCDQKWFSVIQNGRRQPFCEKNVQTNKSCVLIWNGEKCDRNWISIIQYGHKAPSLLETIYRDDCTLISVNYSEILYLVSDITQHHSLCYM